MQWVAILNTQNLIGHDTSPDINLSPAIMHLIENIKIGLDNCNSLICMFLALLSIEMMQAGLVEVDDSTVVCVSKT